MRLLAFLYRAILITLKNFKSFCMLNGSFVHRVMLIYFINIYNEFIVMDIAGGGRKQLHSGWRQRRWLICNV